MIYLYYDLSGGQDYPPGFQQPGPEFPLRLADKPRILPPKIITQNLWCGLSARPFVPSFPLSNLMPSTKLQIFHERISCCHTKPYEKNCGKGRRTCLETNTRKKINQMSKLVIEMVFFFLLKQ